MQKLTQTTVLKRMMSSMKTGFSWVLNCVDIRFYASSAGNELATCSTSSTDKWCGTCEWRGSSEDKEKDGWEPDQVPSLIKELLIKMLNHWFRHTDLTWQCNILNLKLALFQLKCEVWTEQLSKILLDKSGIHTGIQVPFFIIFVSQSGKSITLTFMFSHVFNIFNTSLQIRFPAFIVFYPLFLQVWQIDFTQYIFSHLVCLP